MQDYENEYKRQGKILPSDIYHKQWKKLGDKLCWPTDEKDRVCSKHESK